MRAQGMLIAVMAGAWAMVAPAQAQIVNGNFEAGLPLGGAWVFDDNVSPITRPSGNTLALLEEPGAGGKSRLYQDFIVPAGHGTLWLRYQFSFHPRTRQSTVPPDSFTIFLIDPANGTRLVPQNGSSAPDFSKGLLDTDSDAETVFDGTLITREGPDSQGAYRVGVSTASLQAGNTVRLAFVLACGDNGVQSYVQIDDVQMDCPFQDDFERTAGQALGNGWLEAERGTFENGVVTLDGGTALLMGGAGNAPMAWIAQNNLYLLGYSEVVIAYDWASVGSVGQSSFDNLWVEWRPCSASDWPEFTEGAATFRFMAIRAILCVYAR